MKSKIIFSLCMIVMFGCMIGCRGNEVVETTEVKAEQKVEDEQVISPTCDILVSSDFMCDKPVGTGIYTNHVQWEKAIEGTDVEVVLERKDMYDETFFEDKALVYLVDCSSGGAQFKYEGHKIEDEDGSKKLTIQLLGSTEHLLNTIHAYHVFFVMDKSDAEKLEEANISKSWID